MMPIKANNTPVRPVWSILSKGRTGTGKTIASCGKEFRPTYVFNCEGRFESVINYYRRLDGHCDDLVYDDFHMGSGFHPLDKQMDALVARPEYKTVVMASLTSYIHIVLKHLMSATIPKEGTPAGKQARNIRMKGGIQVNILEDYNFEDAAIIFELLAFLQQLKSMGVNVILEAHISPYEIKTINEETNQREEQTVMQILTKGKKGPAQIPGYFNEVYLFEKKFEGIIAGESKAKYYCNTAGSAVDECKTSMGINSFEWSGQDFSKLLIGQLTQEVKDTPRVDPNAPKAISF